MRLHDNLKSLFGREEAKKIGNRLSTRPHSFKLNDETYLNSKLTKVIYNLFVQLSVPTVSRKLRLKYFLI